MKTTNKSVKYEVLAGQYLPAFLDISVSQLTLRSKYIQDIKW